MSTKFIPWVTYAEGCHDRLVTMSKSEVYVNDLLWDLTLDHDNVNELLHSLDRALSNLPKHDFPLKVSRDHILIDILNRWWLREEPNNEPLAVGRMSLHSGEICRYLRGIGRVYIHPHLGSLDDVRYSLMNTGGMTVMPDDPIPWTDVKGPILRREGGHPRGVMVDSPKANEVALLQQPDEIWGMLDTLEHHGVAELLIPMNSRLMYDYHRLDMWRFCLTAEWTRLAHKWFPRLGERWVECYINRYAPVQTATVSDIDRLLAISLVLATRLFTVSTVTSAIERSPDYTFLVLFQSAALLHCYEGVEWVMAHGAPRRAALMASVYGYMQTRYQSLCPEKVKINLTNHYQPDIDKYLPGAIDTLNDPEGIWPSRFIMDMVDGIDLGINKG